MKELNKYQTIIFDLNFVCNLKVHMVSIVSFVPETFHLMLINEQIYLELQLMQIFQYFHQLYLQQLLITIIKEKNVRRINYQQSIRACVSSS